MTENAELLFFDTFSHGNTQELNLDLVQFTNPVYVSEIRVIPLGARVQADFPGGVRLGATNPSEFSIEFFVNDLSTPGASTFQNVGVLQYNQNGPIHLVCENKQVPTDGLILRGWYTTVTLAVYGFITKTKPPPSNLVSQNPPPPPPPPASETPPPRVISEYKTAEWVQQHAQVYHKEAILYDVKDLSFEEENPEWSTEKADDSQWEKNEQNSENIPPKDDKKSQHKIKKSEEELPKTSKRHSNVENELSDREEEHPDVKVRDDKKLKVEHSHHSPSKSKHKSKNELKKKIVKHEEIDIKLEYVVISEKRDKTPEPEESVQPATVTETAAHGILTVDPGPLAPEDVESISEEEISETEDIISVDMANMLVTDEVNDTLNETRTPSAHEDSIDMDQFEPILSGSSDIESEEDIDFQDIEFDSNDLMEEPNKIFNPYLFEIQPLTSLTCPYMTEYEWMVLQPKIIEQSVIADDKTEKLKTFLSNIELKQFEDNPDEWVTNVENIIPILESGLAAAEDKADLISKLIDLTNIGLDFEKACYQPKAVFKVRHLKAGILLIERLCHLGEEINTELVKCTNLQHKLLDLYEKEYLAISIKLAILRTLDVSLNYGSGVKSFVNSDSCENGYRRLIKIFCTSRTVRVRYSLANILRKIHLFETLENLYTLTISIPSEDKTNGGGHWTQDVEYLAMYLEEIIRYIREAPLLISQPIRFLPFGSRFEFPYSTVNGHFVLYSYFRHFHFLDLLLAVITTPLLCSNSNILSCVLEILAELLDSENGLLYLATQTTTINRILKLLLNAEDQYSVSLQLGLHMAYCMYILNLIDCFQYKWQIEQSTDIDNTQLLEITSTLFCLTFTTLGRQSATHVLSRGDLIKPFLKALEYSHNTGRERRKSPGKAYITDLMWMVIRYSDHVPFLQKHRTDLIDIASWQSDPTYSSWLNPIRTENFLSYNDVTDLCDYLKKHTEKVITYPGELITALRILRYLSISSIGHENDNESTELRYRYVLIQLFSQEGLTFMTSMLHKICNHYERPHLHAYALAGKEGLAMMSVLLPTLQLIRALIDYVVRCRDVDFKDLTALPALLKTYCLLYSIPATSPIHGEAIDASKEIIETLLVYTQTVAIEPSSDSRFLDRSLWTSMMAEVLRFSVSVPEMFVPCLSLLSELLPLPLPVQTRQPLNEVEIALVANSRKLWSAHMLPLENALHEMISALCWSSYQILLQLLKRVCIQFADLGPPSALVVARAILDNLWMGIQNNERNLTGRCARLLNVFACLLTHPPLKMTVIQITSASSKSDETFSEFWPTLIKYLLQPVDRNSVNVQVHESILTSIQCLCDIGISMYPPPGQNISLEAYLSNSLPPKHLFRPMCDALVRCLADTENSFSILSSSVRVCVTLTEYDYGLYRLKNCLSEHSNALYNVLNKVSVEWNKENADCINCLSNLLEFLKECLVRDVITDPDVKLRTLCVNSVELVNWLKWNGELNVNQKHPLDQIDNYLSECAADEELFQSLRSGINALMETLNAAHTTESETDPIIEMIVNPPELLLTQFQMRSMFILGDVEDDRLSVAYWLSVTTVDDMEQDAEQVICNLEEVVNTHISNLQLEIELEKLGHREALTHIEQTSKKVETNEQMDEFESKPIPTVLAVKSVKPRTFVRPITGPHRNDAFRSRIPNSSRAPSLHVDDFIALEKHNQQQAATAAYSRVAGKHQVQEAAVVRNRNHTFLQERGNHFHSPFRPGRGVLNTWHPLIAAEQAGRQIVKAQPTVIRHPGAAPLMIRGADLMRFSLSLRWPTPPLRPPPPPQMRHHPPSHATIHRHLRPPPPTFSPL